ncbi:phosphorylase family protein, partial [Clostridioides difficile]|uniref:phosphorylase family protein n=1 Tax=Clostridioides difficile TaxID=1496 RepID=UPI003F8D6646
GGYCGEMEGGAIAHVCYLNNTPFVIIRAMSDKADGSADVTYDGFFLACYTVILNGNSTITHLKG